MDIRHADPTRDAAACAEIYAPYVRETAISFEEQPPDEREMARRIDHYSATHAWLVTEDAGTAIGFAYACPHRDRAAYRWAADVSVYVRQGHHRRGIGRALYGELLPLLGRSGVCVACAGVTLPNPASVKLHESFGFEPVGIYRRIGYKAGAWWDVGWWQLALREPGGEAPAEPRSPMRASRQR